MIEQTNYLLIIIRNNLKRCLKKSHDCENVKIQVPRNWQRDTFTLIKWMNESYECQNNRGEVTTNIWIPIRWHQTTLTENFEICYINFIRYLYIFILNHINCNTPNRSKMLNWTMELKNHSIGNVGLLILIS